MHERRNYANPPVVEALCDIRFEPGQEWDWTIPGLLYAKVMEEFPHKEQTEQLAFQVRQGELAGQTSTRRMRFFNEDRTVLLQVGTDTLVINCLRPYPGWHGFRPTVVSAIENYRSVASPAGVASCALRYINRIDFPGPNVVLEEYLQTYPKLPSNLPEQLVGWSLALDIPASSGIMRVKAGSVPADEGAAFLVDLRFLATEPETLELGDSLLQWIDAAHDIIEETFEASITDEARALFNETREEVVHEQLRMGRG